MREGKKKSSSNGLREIQTAVTGIVEVNGAHSHFLGYRLQSS